MDLYRMTAKHVAIAAQHLHNNVRPGKWLYQQSDETITPTLLATFVEMAVDQNRARLTLDENGEMTGTNFDTLQDTDMVPTIVVVAIDPKASKAVTTQALWRLWKNDAFMRNTTIFVAAPDTLDRMLIDRMVKFGYKAEETA